METGYQREDALFVKDCLAAAGRQMYACVVTFGCQQNEADSEKLRGMCREMGYAMTEAPEEADLILMNTCAVREHAEQRALSILGSFKHLKEKKPSLIIGVCGCMAAKPDRVQQFRRSLGYVNFSMRPGDLHRLPEMLKNAMTGGRRLFLEGEDSPPIAEEVPTLREHTHKAYISIMVGCNNFCSYCIVPHVRGRERSRASGAILREAESLIRGGCREIMLLGQNVNSYRSDCDFSTLLRRIDQIPGDYVLRFMSSHPKDVPEDLIRAMAECTHIEKHFHLPLQSGSDKVLSEMNRRYTGEKYLSIVRRLREAVPDIALTSDVMVGFPGETEEDFLATLELLRRAEFDMVYSFIYSPRPGTPAAEREDQVPEAVKGERMRRLLALQDEISFGKNQQEVGRTLRILLDGKDKSGENYNGRTESGKLVHLPARDTEIGSFLKVKILRAEPYALIAKRTEETV